MNQDKYFSHKITFLNIFLTLNIVLLHSKTPERWGLVLDLSYPFIYWTHVFTQIGVPTFFFISGLLFYRKCTFIDIERKLKSRISSLLIPYFIWNTLFVTLFFVMIHTPFIHNKMNMGDGLNTPYEIIYAIVNSKFTVLWFVKDLLIFNSISAIIFLMLSRIKSALIFLCISIFIALYIDTNYENPCNWFPMYFSGAILGRFLAFDKNGSYMFIQNYIPIRKVNLLSLILIFTFIILWILSGLYSNYFIFWYRFISPIIIWVLVDIQLKKYLENKFQIHSWMQHMFFIYCTHHFVLNIIQKIVMLNYPPSHTILNATFIISPIITIIILISVASILSKHTYFKYLTGGR